MKSEATELSVSLNGYLNIYKSLMASAIKSIDYYNMSDSDKNCTNKGCLI